MGFNETHLIPNEQLLYFNEPDGVIRDPITDESFGDMVFRMRRYIDNDAWSPTLILRKRQINEQVWQMFQAARKRIDDLQGKIQRLQHQLRKR